jgi:hypothetical protein
MQINGFEYNKLDILSKDINHPTYGIPTDYGMYSWVYWPKFDEKTITPTDLKDLVVFYSKNNFYIEEKFNGLYKFKGMIWEQGYPDNGNMFGLSDSKHNTLESFFSNRADIIFFSEFFKELCFARPFYVGKANNLRKRLSSHFSGKSNVLPDITTKGIPQKDIWVGYKTINAPTTTLVNTIFEEIYTRRVKPGLSIKPN